jgi:hypothetical protein
MPLPHWLAVSPHAEVLQSLHGVAWNDGVLSGEERVMIGALVRRLGLSPSEDELATWLDKRSDPWMGVPRIEGSFERRFLISEAIRVAYEDGDYSPEEERRFLGWAQAWGIDPDEVASLEAEHLHAKSTRDPFKL